MLGLTNNLIATILSTTSYPMIAMFPTFSTDTVGGSLIPGPFCDYKCTGGFHTSTQYSGVKRINQTINLIQKTQDLIIDSYLLNHMALNAKFFDNKTKCLILPSRFFNNAKNIKSLEPKVLLGIKRNNKGIKYYKTVNVCVDFKSKHYHVVYPQYYMKDKYSWLVQDEDFYDKKIVAIATNNYKENKDYPILSKILNIKLPDLYAVSCAGLYNVDGAMFSSVESSDTGLSYVTSALLSPMILRQLKVFYDVVEASSMIPILGDILAAVEIAYGLYYVEQVAEKLITQPRNKNTPIYKYNEAELGGWDAHLVPLRTDNKV